MQAIGDTAKAMAYAPPARHLLRARDLADNRYADKLDVEDMAKAAGLSKTHFSREFKAAFGESFVTALTTLLGHSFHLGIRAAAPAMAALLFLYGTVLRRPLTRIQGVERARVIRRVPVVLTPAEVRAVLDRLQNPERLVVSLLYGSGLRISECVALRVKDVDCDRREITVRGGKGDRDRRAPMAESVIKDLRRAMHAAHETWRGDCRSRARTIRR